MTQDEVIALAREVGIEDGNIPALAWGRLETGIELLTYFAAAVEAKVKADLLAGAGEPVAYALANQEKTSGSPCPTCVSLARAVMMDQTGEA